MKQKLPAATQTGFTLIEVTLAAMVMAMVLGSSLVVLGRGFKVLDSARAVSYASQVMQSELEKMRLTPWGDGTTAGTGTTGVSAYATSLTTIPIDTSFFVAGDYASRMTLQRKVEDVHDGMIKITLTVTWKTVDQRTMTRSYITYYGKNALYDGFIL
jgi:Tfp pilus assembly protein PilV